jgi:hypothetical protein
MSLLDRLNKREALVKAKMAEEDRLKKEVKYTPQTPSKDDSKVGWMINDKKPMSESKSKSEIPFIARKMNICKVLVDDLVWAPYADFTRYHRVKSKFPQKNGGYYLPGRVIRNKGDLALVPNLELPLQEGKCVVQFFGLPNNDSFWWKYLIVEKKNLFPYWKPTTVGKKIQGTLTFSMDESNLNEMKNRWDIDNSNYLKDLLCAMCMDKKEGEKQHSRLMKIAKKFLECALSHADISSTLNARVDDDEVDVDFDTTRDEKEEDIDFAKYENTIRKTPQELRAGDWIRYTCRIMKNVIESRIVEVDPAKDNPLVLESGDIIQSLDVLHRFDSDPNGKYIENSGSSRILKEYTLIAGKANNAKNMVARFKRIAEQGNHIMVEAGLKLNERKESKMLKTS